MYRMKSVLKIVLVLGVMVFAQPAKAELELNITKGSVQALPVAITSFHSLNDDTVVYGQRVALVVSENLERTGLFAPLSHRAFIQNSASIHADGPRFAEWRAINAEALVTGNVMRAKDGRIRIEFRLWDIFGERQLIGMAYTTEEDNWRRIAHIISDQIYKRLTGEDGYFDSRIVYIAESGPADARVKRLAIMDQDGANHKYLTDGRALVLTPRFSPNQQKITYLAYYNDRPRVYIYDIQTGKQEVLGNFPGMTFAPRFSPDGNSVIMSYAKNGNSDIYVLDLRSRKARQLTSHYAIDTSPSFSPDGKQVVFESDRGGSQQLYVMDADGSNPHRITFGNGRYGNPVWSPRGDLIAFTRIYKGKFYIGVIRPDGSGERLITEAYHVEGPTWSPNGRILAYFKEVPVGRSGQSRKARVYTIDLTGFNEREIATPGDGSDPAWSPINQ